MATILLLRHAKSRWDEPGIDDHDRGLAPRGLRDAPAMGRYAAARGWLPERVLCSTARRAVLTARAFLEAARATPAIRQDRSIYLAPASRLLALIRQQAGPSLMLVGHDPGIHELALMLAGPSACDRLRAKFPTGGLAVLDCPDLAPAQIASGAGRLIAFVRPREIAS